MAENYLPPELDLVKLYLAQYPLEGRTKPRARDAFIRSFNEGALILTFLGHGNWRTLAHERMFVVSRDLDAIDNGRRLPLMYMAASQVGTFRRSRAQLHAGGSAEAAGGGHHRYDFGHEGRLPRQQYDPGIQVPRADVPAPAAPMSPWALP